MFGRAGIGYSGYRVIPALDGGYWVGGETYPTDSTVQYWVARFSPKGVMLWDSTYGGDLQDFLWSIQPSSDGGLLLAGYTGKQWSGAETALMLRIDANGHTVARYEDVDPARGVHSHFVGERPQGGFVWAGHTVDSVTIAGRVVAGMLDANFHPVWEKRFTLGSMAHGHCAVVTNDGGIMIAGHSDSIDQTTHYFAMRLDSNGNQLWSNMYVSSSSMNDEPYGVCHTRRGGFAIFGGSYANTSSMWLLVVDADGKTILDKHYGSPTGWANSGIQCADGGYLIIGTIGATTNEIYAVKTDSLGNTEWTKTFTATGNATGNDVFEHKNQFVMVGEADNGQVAGLWALYTDSKGVQAPYDTTSVQTGSVATTLPNGSNGIAISPNPMLAGSHTTISFSAEDARSLVIYNALGQELYAHSIANGAKLVQWDGLSSDGTSVAPGLYLAVVRAPTGSFEEKLMVR